MLLDRMRIRLENSDSSRDNIGTNLPFGRSHLRKAIERDLSNGKLREELRELGNLREIYRCLP
jgi:hypothetical protein